MVLTSTWSNQASSFRGGRFLDLPRRDDRISLRFWSSTLSKLQSSKKWFHQSLFMANLDRRRSAQLSHLIKTQLSVNQLNQEHWKSNIEHWRNHSQHSRWIPDQRNTQETQHYPWFSSRWSRCRFRKNWWWCVSVSKNVADILKIPLQRTHIEANGFGSRQPSLIKWSLHVLDPSMT